MRSPKTRLLKMIGSVYVKILVKRDKHCKFEKAKIELDNSHELATITLALMWAVEKEKETLRKSQSMKWESEEEREKYIRGIKERLDEFQETYKQLDAPWVVYT